MTIQEYDQNNIFAKILRGEAPSYKVYEDEHTYVMMDIMPRADGHTLVIPKAPARNILDIDTQSLHAVMTTAQHVAKAAKHAFKADGISIMQFSEAAGGQVVFHMHVHILPRQDGIELHAPGIMGDQDAIKRHAELLKSALDHGLINKA